MSCRCLLTLLITLFLSAGTLNCGGISSANGGKNDPSGSQNPGGTGGNQQGPTFSGLQGSSGWTGYGLLPTLYAICQSCLPAGPQVTWAMTPNIESPSQSGNATQFDIGGQTSFSDVLWNNHLIGDFSSQGLPDKDHTLVSGLHNFTYDVYFYATDLSASQALEFDINQFTDGLSFIWGHECRIAGGNEWDIWDNQAKKWHSTGASCKPQNNAWNHLILQVQRTQDDKLIFQSITLNGEQTTLNYQEDPTSSTWHGITINYQQDGNRAQSPYSIWLDRLNFTYW